MCSVQPDYIKSCDMVDAYLRYLLARNGIPKRPVSPVMLTDVLYKSSYPHADKILAMGWDH